MGYFIRLWTKEDISNSADIPDHMMVSLRMHYLLLFFTTFLMMIGAFSHHLWAFGDLWTILVLICSVSLLCMVSQEDRLKTVLLLCAAALSAGVSTAALLHLVLDIDTRFVVTAFGVIALTPAWFLIAAMFTNSRSPLYFWSVCPSYFSVLTLLRVAPSIRHLALYMLVYQFYPLYIVAYSQQIIHEAGGHNFDHIRATLHFFTDFPAVLIRLCRI